MTTPRRGRRPGDPETTRQAILDAARRSFAEHGFDRATIRSIAADAGVDPALVIHYFGSKRELFVAAHELPADPAEVFAPIADLPVAERGEAFARAYLRLFAHESSAGLSLLRAAATDDGAAAMLREFIEHHVMPVGVTVLDHPDDDGELRVTLIASHLLGLAVARRLIGIAAVAERDLDELVVAVSPTIQHYIDGTG